MKGFFYFVSGGLISPKVKTGQIWVRDDHARYFSRDDFVEVLSVINRYVEFKLPNGIIRIEPVGNFKSTNALYMDVE